MILAIALSARYKSLNYLKKWNWCNSTFKLLGSYSLKFQFISILQILYDPITKGLLGRFSGLQSVAYYEMSNRLISQIRNIIVNSNQVLVPVIASSKNISGTSIENIYIKSFQLVSLISLFSMVISVASCSYICFYWVGSFNRDFILCTTILSVSMFFNIISGPAYFGNIGEGTLRPLLYQHSFLAIANVFLALLLNFLGVLYGSVWAWGISLFLASAYMLLNYQSRKKIKFSHVLKVDDYSITSFALIITILFCYLNNLEIKGISHVFMYLWLRLAIIFSFTIYILIVKKKVLLALIKKRF
jgi:O-antigen/teichoic acid export membrane protein